MPGGRETLNSNPMWGETRGLSQGPQQPPPPAALGTNASCPGRPWKPRALLSPPLSASVLFLLPFCVGLCQRHLPILTMGPRERAHPSAGQLPLPHRSGIREFMRQVQLLLLCLRSYPGGPLVFCVSQGQGLPALRPLDKCWGFPLPAHWPSVSLFPPLSNTTL